MNFKNSYAKLPKTFYSKTLPESFIHPNLLAFNTELATELNLEELNSYTKEELARFFTGQKLFENASYISLAYSGHQFGHFNPTLGDGRALLISEVEKDNELFDIVLKGSGKTAYSRRGDGLSALGPVLREYIVSESFYHLGIPATRALAACTTGNSVYRQTEEPGGVFTRVAKSHIRVGTFEYFASRAEKENLLTLLDYTLKRHYPDLINLEQKEKVFQFIKEVALSQSALIRKWLSFGFIHGVMNTDNVSISGQTIDFGPCAFMDYFEKEKVYSFIDKGGRYRYDRQPDIGLWNMYQLANALFYLLEESDLDDLQNHMKSLHFEFENLLEKAICEKLGLLISNDHDFKEVNKLLTQLEKNNEDFTTFFFNVLESNIDEDKYSDFINWYTKRKESNYSADLQRSLTPYLIPRNHIIEKIISEANEENYRPFKDYIELLKKPFQKPTSFTKEFLPPKDEEVVPNTFCGT